MFFKHHIKISIAICEIHQFHLYFSHEKHMVFSFAQDTAYAYRVWDVLRAFGSYFRVQSSYKKTLKTFKSLFKNLKPFFKSGFFSSPCPEVSQGRIIVCRVTVFYTSHC